MSRTLRCVLAASLLFLTSTPASGATAVLYTDRAAWEVAAAAVGPVGNITSFGTSGSHTSAAPLIGGGSIAFPPAWIYPVLPGRDNWFFSQEGQLLILDNRTSIDIVPTGLAALGLQSWTSEFGFEFGLEFTATLDNAPRCRRPTVAPSFSLDMSAPA